MGRNEERAELERACLALRAGTTSEDGFLRATAAFWRRLARNLYAGWRRKMPGWVEVDDVEQVLRLEAVLHVRTWDPSKTPSAAAYVAWAARHRAQREIHRWRGARIHGNEGKNPSHFEIPASATVRPGDEDRADVVDRASAPEADPTDGIEGREVLAEVLSDCKTVREAIVLLALREHGGEVAATAAAIWEDFRARVECALSDEEHAERVVSATLARLAERFARSAA